MQHDETAGVPRAGVKETISLLAADMLNRFHSHGAHRELTERLNEVVSGKEPLDERIEQALANRGVPLAPCRNTLAPLLVSLPGQIKVALVKEAARQVAEETGLRLRHNPNRGESVSRNDLVLHATPLNEGAFISDWNVESLSRAGASILLMDQVLTATPVARKALRRLNDNGRSGAIELSERTYLALSGTLTGAMEASRQIEDWSGVKAIQVDADMTAVQSTSETQESSLVDQCFFQPSAAGAQARP